jgi:hypothetical protein
VTTNRDLLVGILRCEEFLAGRTDTGFLTRPRPRRAVPSDPGARRAGSAAHAAAAALARQARHRRDAAVLGGLPSGWRNRPSVPQHVAYTRGGDTG